MAIISSGSITLVDLSELVSYKLSPSVATIMKDVNNEGALSAPSVTFTAEKYIGDTLQEGFKGFILLEYVGPLGIEMRESGEGPTITTSYLEDGIDYSEIRATLYESNQLSTILDQQLIFIIETGKNGEPGAGYSIFLSSDSYVFKGNTLGAILEKTISLKIEAYESQNKLGILQLILKEGQTEVTEDSDTDLIISSPFDPETGIFTLKTNKPFSESGIIEITCVTPKMTFNKNFSYGVVLKGENGLAEDVVEKVTLYTTVTDSLENIPETPTIEQTINSEELEGKEFWSQGLSADYVPGENSLWGSYYIEFSIEGIDNQFTIPFYLENYNDDTILSSAIEPETAEEGDLWLDTVSSPQVLKRYTKSVEQEEDGTFHDIWFWQETVSSLVQTNGILSQIKKNETLIAKQDSNIQLQATTLSETKTALSAFSSQVTSLLDIDSTGASLVFSRFQTSIDEANVSTTPFYQNLETNFHFDLDGLTIGKQDDPLTMKLTNEALEFYINGSISAYLNGEDQALYIKDGKFIKSINIGNYSWQLEQDGSLSLSYNTSNT